MSALALNSPFVPIMDLTANGLNGGQVYIGIANMDPQTNPQAVWWDAATTQAADQPLEVEGGYIMRTGTPTLAYTANPYSIRVLDRNNAVVFYETAVYGYATQDEIPCIYPTLALAIAASPPAGTPWLETLGGLAVGDGGRDLYMPSTAGAAVGKIQTANGAWWIKQSAFVNVMQFLADRSGAASSLTAFNNAIAWANARVSGTLGNYVGVSIGVPDGQYKLDGNCTPIAGSAITIVGESLAAVLNLSGSGSAFTWNNAAYAGGAKNLTMGYPGNPGSGAALFTISKAQSQVFENIDIFNINRLIVLGTDASHTASNITLKQILGNGYNIGNEMVTIGWGSALFLSAINIFVADVPVPTFDRTSTMATASGRNFIGATQGGWDLISYTPDCTVGRFWSSIYINAPGSVFSNILLNGSTHDYCSSDAISLNAATNATGGIFSVITGSAYIVSWSGSAILVTGDNPNQNHDFSGAKPYITGLDAISISGAATYNIKMVGVKISNPNRIAGDYSGINIGVTQGHYTIVGCTCLSDPSGDYAWSATYGITIAPNTGDYTVTDCEMVGSTMNYNIDADSTADSNRLVANNRQADYATVRTTGIFVTPSLPGDWTNTSPFNVRVAMTGMNSGISMVDRNGTTMGPVPLLTAAMMVAAPGEIIRVGSTGSNFMGFMVMP